MIQLLRDDHVVTSGTISLVDTTFSRRAWPHTPVDVHRSNGRVRHSRLTAHVGPLLTVQLHNYESLERRHRREFVGDPADPGGWNHFDLYVFRNTGVIGGKPFERIRAHDLAGEDPTYAGALDEAQRDSLEKFLAGEPPAVTFGEYQRTCRLLSLLLTASAKERRGELPVIDAVW